MVRSTSVARGAVFLVGDECWLVFTSPGRRRYFPTHLPASKWQEADQLRREIESCAEMLSMPSEQRACA